MKEAVKANIGLSVPWTEMTEEKFGLAVNEVSRYSATSQIFQNIYTKYLSAGVVQPLVPKLCHRAERFDP